MIISESGSPSRDYKEKKFTITKNDLFNKLLENTTMDVGDSEVFDEWCKEANEHIEDYI